MILGISKSNFDFVIFGGGVAGCHLANQLTNIGFAGLIIEKQPYLGGKIINFCCKATDECARCNVCLGNMSIRNTKNSDKIKIILGANIEDIGRTNKEMFSVKIKTADNAFIEISTASVILATGYIPYEPSTESKLESGILANVITTYNLENIFAESSLLRNPINNSLPQNIAFVQCVGSRNLNFIGKGKECSYCSTVCCPTSLRLSLLIADRQPETKITIYYIDFQHIGFHSPELLKKASKNGRIILKRGIPAKAKPLEDGKVRLLVEDFKSNTLISNDVDLLVLAVGIRANMSNSSIFATLGIEQDKQGFYIKETLPKGVFAVGSCTAPMDIKKVFFDTEVEANKIETYLRLQNISNSCRTGFISLPNGAH